MEKYKSHTPDAKARSLKLEIAEMQERKLVREIADSLEPLQLDKSSLILRKGAKACAVHPEATKQLEELGNMGLSLGWDATFELRTFGVGWAVNKNVTYAKEFVLPHLSKVLTVRPFHNITAGIKEKPPSMLHQLLDEEGKYGRKMTRLVADIVDKGNEDDKELLRKYRSRLREIFGPITFEEIVKTPWEMVSYPRTVAYTRHYADMVKSSPWVFVLDLHIHPGLKKTPASIKDAWIFAGPHQFCEWSGILHVGRRGFLRPFELGLDSLSVYYSDMEDVEWLRKAVSELSKTGFPTRFRRGFEELFFKTSVVTRDFMKSHRADVVTYEQLVEEAE